MRPEVELKQLQSVKFPIFVNESICVLGNVFKVQFLSLPTALYGDGPALYDSLIFHLSLKNQMFG